MRIATSAQFTLFRRRRPRALLIEVAALVLAPISAVLVLVVLGEQDATSRVASAVAFLAVALGGQAIRSAYFRCPACDKPLNRGPRHIPFGDAAVTTCRHCSTRFEG
jgi:uncharacterized Zn-finger protein